MNRVLRNERGMALALAIVALVIVGALVAGAFFAGTQEQRVGENARRLQQSFGIAEGGAYDVLRGWKPESINVKAIFPADSYKVKKTATPSGGSFSGVVYKLNRNVYLLDITGQDRGSKQPGLRLGGARQRVGLLARVRPLDIKIEASLTTSGDVKLAGNALVDGNTHIPPNWTNCDAVRDTSKAGIRTPDTAAVSGEQTHATGNPPMKYDPTVSDSTFNKFGDVTYADLVARATINFPGSVTLSTEPVSVGGVCDKTVNTNWGDGLNPTAPCGSYFPMIHIAGNVTLNNTQGQGILLVDGDVNVQGSYEFFGITIVKGSFKTSGGGTSIAHFWGGVMAQNVDLETQNLTGNATLNYSKCAILKALQYTQVAALMRARSFTQPY
jgi:hypothetical protein